MSAPKPYYQTPDGRVRLYLGDCRELLPLVAPPSPRVLALVDRPYGIKAKTKNEQAKRGHGAIYIQGKRRANNAKGRDFPPIAGDDRPADASDLAAYPRRLEWGWNHFAATLPPSPSMIVWDKRAGTGPDDGADCEIAWTNFGGPARVFHHLWRGLCRGSEKGADGQALNLHPTQKPEAFYRWLFAGRGRGKPVVSPGDLIVVPYAGSGPEIPPSMELGLEVVAMDVEREHLDTIIKHRIEPALLAARQIDIWAPKPPAPEQPSLFAGASQ